jgi:hypothetical protein
VCFPHTFHSLMFGIMLGPCAGMRWLPRWDASDGARSRADVRMEWRMISLLIRLVLGKSSGSFWTGLVMLIAGVGLTVGSYMAATSLGGVTFVFYGLIIGGIVRMILSASTLRSSGHTGYRGSRPYMTGVPGYQTGGPPILPYGASPTQAVPGHCWLCGGKVKRGSSICLHCGASLGTPQQQESEVAQMAGYSMSSSMVAVPSPRPPTPHPATWHYQPSAPEQPRGPYSPPEQPRGPYSPPEQPRGPYAPPQQGYGPYSAPQQPNGPYSAPVRRRGSRRSHSAPEPEMPLRIFEPPVRPSRPPRGEPRGDPNAGDARDWGPPPPRRGQRY